MTDPTPTQDARGRCAVSGAAVHRCDSPGYSDLHAFLVGLIRDSGYTQRDLAVATGITEKHMSFLMTGRSEGSLNLWSALLAAADVRLEPAALPPDHAYDSAAAARAVADGDQALRTGGGL